MVDGVDCVDAQETEERLGRAWLRTFHMKGHKENSLVIPPVLRLSFVGKKTWLQLFGA